MENKTYPHISWLFWVLGSLLVRVYGVWGSLVLLQTETISIHFWRRRKKPLEDLLISSLTEACVSLLPIKEGKTFPPLFMNVKSVKPINVCIICWLMQSYHRSDIWTHAWSKHVTYVSWTFCCKGLQSKHLELPYLPMSLFAWFYLRVLSITRLFFFRLPLLFVNLNARCSIITFWLRSWFW